MLYYKSFSPDCVINEELIFSQFWSIFPHIFIVFLLFFLYILIIDYIYDILICSFVFF